MNNEPVAYINVEERKLEWAKPTAWETPTIAKMDKVPLYTQEQLEEARKLGMQQERALWNLSESTQEIMNTHPVKKLSRMAVYELAIESGFMLSTQYGEAEHKLMPVSDGDTLVKFARAILIKAQEK